MTRPVINVADGETHSDEHGDHFAFTMTELASELGARAIGANLTRVPPGKAAFPFHHHHANEEHFFVLSGTGVLRYGDKTYPVKEHDYVVNLPGGPERAHQLINTGERELVYLAISTSVFPEVVGFPDSGKTYVRTALAGGDDDASRFMVADDSRRALRRLEGEDGKRVAAVVSRARG